MRRHEGGYYIRLSVLDKVGAFAAITKRMAAHDISLESIVQKRPAQALPGIGAEDTQGKPTPVVMITHPTRELDVRNAMAEIKQDGYVIDTPQVIRIEQHV